MVTSKSQYLHLFMCLYSTVCYIFGLVGVDANHRYAKRIKVYFEVFRQHVPDDTQRIIITNKTKAQWTGRKFVCREGSTLQRVSAAIHPSCPYDTVARWTLLPNKWHVAACLEFAKRHLKDCNSTRNKYYLVFWVLNLKKMTWIPSGKNLVALTV